MPVAVPDTVGVFVAVEVDVLDGVILVVGVEDGVLVGVSVAVLVSV